MTSQPDLEQRIREFAHELDDEQLEFALVELAQRRGRDAPRILALLAATWPAEQAVLLDVAARHQALAGAEERVRSLLELLASQHGWRAGSVVSRAVCSMSKSACCCSRHRSRARRYARSGTSRCSSPATPQWRSG